MRQLLVATVAAGALVALAAAQLADGPASERWREAGPAHDWSFPRDHYAHPGYKTEWWYVTGQTAAADDPGRRFGFQFTLFRVGITPSRPDLASDWAASDLVMGHAAITDLGARTHTFSEVLLRAAAGLGGFGAPGDSIIAWSRAPAGTDGRWQLCRRGDGFTIEAADRRRGLALSLDLLPERPLVLQGPGGFNVKDPASGAGSLYYSFTRLATRGTLVAGEDTVRVAGRSWLDHETFSSQLGAGQVGWDWFSLQLDDGRDLMLYRLRGEGSEVSHAQGTVVDPAGAVRYLAGADWRLDVTRRWRSEETGADYPVAWRIEVPGEGLDLAVEALLDAQENVSQRTGGLFYWEGAVEARPRAGGGPAGRGYAELTGYGSGRLPL